MTSNHNWRDGLEGSTERIVFTDASPLMVVAGPGTGKTYAIVRRVARLLDAGVPSENIMVSTFTRTAANDLARELRLLNVPRIDGVLAGTIHSYCFALLHNAQVLEVTGRVPRPLMEFEQRFLLEDLTGDGFGNVHERERRIEAFTAAWARLQHEQPGWPTDAVDARFHAELLRWLTFHEAMLIGEVVPETLAYLRNNPLGPGQPDFEHVIVDEYQDLNRAEQVLLDTVAGAGSLTVVGDEDQSIYSFKYANREGIADFRDYHDHPAVEHLIHCRRCPRRVIEMANALISRNPTRSDRVLVPHEERPEGQIRILQWPTLDEEAQGLARIVHRTINDGKVSAGKVLVLAPRRQMGYQIRDELLSLGVDARSFFNEQELDGDPKNLDRSQAQISYTLLTLLAHPNDRVALRCWVGFGSPSLRTGEWRRLQTYCDNTNVGPLTALEQLVSGEARVSHTGGIVSRFRALKEHIRELSGTTGSALLDALYSEEMEWTEPFRQIAETYLESDEYDAGDLLDAIQRAVSQPELPTAVEYVRVMSLHKSKGLTADMVVISSLCEGLLPSVRRPTSHLSAGEHDEEQRRLFFVALTRPRELLVLSSVTHVPADLAHRWSMRSAGWGPRGIRTIASRFLRELGPSAPEAQRGSDIEPF